MQYSTGTAAVLFTSRRRPLHYCVQSEAVDRQRLPAARLHSGTNATQGPAAWICCSAGSNSTSRKLPAPPPLPPGAAADVLLAVLTAAAADGAACNDGIATSAAGSSACPVVLSCPVAPVNTRSCPLCNSLSCSKGGWPDSSTTCFLDGSKYSQQLLAVASASGAAGEA